MKGWLGMLVERVDEWLDGWVVMLVCGQVSD